MESYPGPEYPPNPNLNPDPTVPMNAAPVATMPPAPTMPPTVPAMPLAPAPGAPGAPGSSAGRAGIGVALVVVVTIVVTAIVASTIGPALAQARIAAYPQPSVAITVGGGSTVRVGDTVQFTAQVNAGNDLTFAWDFGDGATGSGAAVQHTYQNYGTMNVQLVASDPIGQHAGASSQVSVLPPPPQACFNATGDPNDPFVVDFDASCSTGAQLQFYWDFGDGSTDNSGGDQQTQNQYASLGTYHVSLRVVDTSGQSDSVTHDVQVQLPRPTASFTVSNDFGDCFSFDASASTGYQLTYNWSFGDGNTSTGNSYSGASNCYASSGSYTVQLTVTDAGNQSASTSQTVNAP